MLYTISCYIGPRYNGTGLCFCQSFTDKLPLSKVNSLFAIQFQLQFQFLFITLQPSGLEGYCHTGTAGRAGGQPDWQTLRNAYLWNCWMDFHCSKLNGIVLTWSCAMSWSFVNLSRMGLPIGLKLVKTGTNGVQTLWNTYLWIWNNWTDLLHSKFYGIVWTCSCATSWSFTHLPHMVLPIGQKVVKSGTTGVPTLPNTYLWTAGWICTVWSSMILYKPGVVQYHGLMTFTLDFQG